jgi:hypothetical protein
MHVFLSVVGKSIKSPTLFISIMFCSVLVGWLLEMMYLAYTWC